MFVLRSSSGIHLISNAYYIDFYIAKEGTKYAAFIVINDKKQLLRLFESHNDANLWISYVRDEFLADFDDSEMYQIYRDVHLNEYIEAADDELMKPMLPPENPIYEDD